MLLRSLASAISNLDSAWLIAALSSIAILAIVGLMFARDYKARRIRQADKAVRDFERQHAMLDSLPAAVVVLDTSGKVHLFNDAWLKLVSEDAFNLPDGGKGRHYRQVFRQLTGVPESDPETTLEAGIRRVAKSRDHRFDQDLLTTRQGNWPWFHVYVRTMKDDDTPNVLLMLVNVSARKHQEFDLDTSWDDLVDEEIGNIDPSRIVSGNGLLHRASNVFGGFYRGLVRYNRRVMAAYGALRTSPAFSQSI